MLSGASAIAISYPVSALNQAAVSGSFGMRQM
jgi:hypothetical protein